MTPSDHQIEDLLRSTLQTRAGTVTSGPSWVVPATPARRRRWLPAVAAATVVAVATGALALHGHDVKPVPPADDGRVHACRASLPAQWRAALAAEPDKVDGGPTHALTVTPGGEVVVFWQGQDQKEAVGITDRRGATRRLYSLPAGHKTVSADTDGRFVVVNTDRRTGSTSSGVDGIVSIDLSTGRVRNVPITPAGQVVAGKYGAVVQDGIAYWTVAEHASAEHGGELISYDLSAHALVETVAVSGPAEVIRSAAGVAWAGGSVPVAHLPAHVPPAELEGGRFAYTDGSAFAWSRVGDVRTVEWTDPDVGSRSIPVDLAGMQAQGVEGGVSGDFVTVVANTSDSTHIYALDTRTGALGDLGRMNNTATAGRGVIALDTSGGTVRLDTSTLPELTC